MNWRRRVGGAWSLDALKGASAVWLLVLTVLVIIVAVRGENTRSDVTYVTERVEIKNPCTSTNRVGCRLQLWWMLDAANAAQKAQVRQIRRPAPRPRSTVQPRTPRIVPARPTPRRRTRRQVRPTPRRVLAPVTITPAPVAAAPAVPRPAPPPPAPDKPKKSEKKAHGAAPAADKKAPGKPDKGT